MFAHCTWLLIVTVMGAERLWRVRRVVRGTNLARGPWWWLLAAAVAIVAVEWLTLGLALSPGSTAHPISWPDDLLASPSNSWLPPLRYAVAVTAFGPLMATLGAQSPQERAWPWIVISMWFMLALPAAEVFVLQQGQALEIHFARATFLWILIGLQLVNMLPTHFWRTGLCASASQLTLLSRDLPGLDRIVNLAPLAALQPWLTLIALSLAVLAIADLARGLPNRSTLPPRDQLWLDFRDLFGALWAARIYERLSNAAQLQKLPIVLHWTGWSEQATNPLDFHPNIADNSQCSVLHLANWNLLRRFVSPAWFHARCPDRIETEE